MTDRAAGGKGDVVVGGERQESHQLDAFRRRARGQDDADRAIVSQVVPGPGAQRADAVTKADQVIDVDEDPRQPSEKAGELQSARQVGHSGVATDGRHGALVDVLKWFAFALHAAYGIAART